jgi:hypothetical protein
MIPTIEDIVAGLLAGEFTKEQAISWLKTHAQKDDCEVWQMNSRRRNLSIGGFDEVLQWYWRDRNCEEPIGPFDTEAEAIADYEKYGRKPRIRSRMR